MNSKEQLAEQYADEQNSAYTKDGFRVFATDIISVGVLYHKIGASWVSQAITLVV